MTTLFAIIPKSARDCSIILFAGLISLLDDTAFSRRLPIDVRRSLPCFDIVFHQTPCDSSRTSKFLYTRASILSFIRHVRTYRTIRHVPSNSLAPSSTNWKIGKIQKVERQIFQSILWSLVESTNKEQNLRSFNELSEFILRAPNFYRLCTKLRDSNSNLTFKMQKSEEGEQ